MFFVCEYAKYPVFCPRREIIKLQEYQVNKALWFVQKNGKILLLGIVYFIVSTKNTNYIGNKNIYDGLPSKRRKI